MVKINESPYVLLCIFEPGLHLACFFNNFGLLICEIPRNHRGKLGVEHWGYIQKIVKIILHTVPLLPHV